MTPEQIDNVCSCKSAKVDVLANFLAVSDELVAKALAIPEVTQIARSEMRLRSYLLAKWAARAEQGAAVGARAVSKGADGIVASVDSAMGKFPGDVKKTAQLEVGRVYKLGRRAGWKKAAGHTTASLRYGTPELGGEVQKAKPSKQATVSIEPSFNLADEEAIKRLQIDQMLWIGQHYDKSVRDLVRGVVAAELAKGRSAAVTGKTLEKAIRAALGKVSLPSGARGSEKAYFEGLAANTMTNARVQGQIVSFAELEIEVYEIVNPMDERTTELCAWMNGKKFLVEDAVAHYGKIAGAEAPEDVRRIHPWVGMEFLKGLSSGPGWQGKKDSESLMDAGLGLPPYHWLCRSTVDLSSY